MRARSGTLGILGRELQDEGWRRDKDICLGGMKGRKARMRMRLHPVHSSMSFGDPVGLGVVRKSSELPSTRSSRFPGT